MPRAESKSMDSAVSSAQSEETKTEEKQDFDENELLMYVAADANEHLFGEKSELTQFVNGVEIKTSALIASARWRGDSTPTQRRCPHNRVCSMA